MEQTQNDLFDESVKIDTNTRRHLSGLATWALVVVGTAIGGYVLSLLQAFMGKPTQDSTTEGFGKLLEMDSNDVGSTIFSLVIGMIVYFFLLRFALQTRKSISTMNDDLVAPAIRNLRIYFMIITAILMLVLLGLLAMFALL